MLGTESSAPSVQDTPPGKRFRPSFRTIHKQIDANRAHCNTLAGLPADIRVRRAVRTAPTCLRRISGTAAAGLYRYEILRFVPWRVAVSSKSGFADELRAIMSTHRNSFRSFPAASPMGWTPCTSSTAFFRRTRFPGLAGARRARKRRFVAGFGNFVLNGRRGPTSQPYTPCASSAWGGSVLRPLADPRGEFAQQRHVARRPFCSNFLTALVHRGYSSVK